MRFLCIFVATDDMSKLKPELAQLVQTKDYKTINTLLLRNLRRYQFVKKLISNADEQHASIVDLIDKNRMNYDKVLVKIEDKKECKRMKNCLNNLYKVALYSGDSKEVS